MRFYVEGSLVATHTTNIPSSVPLNPYFSSSWSGSGFVPLRVDWMSFEHQVGADRVVVLQDDFNRG